jgi:hypothetical protein
MTIISCSRLRPPRLRVPPLQIKGCLARLALAASLARSWENRRFDAQGTQPNTPVGLADCPACRLVQARPVESSLPFPSRLVASNRLPALIRAARCGELARQAIVVPCAEASRSTAGQVII